MLIIAFDRETNSCVIRVIVENTNIAYTLEFKRLWLKT